MTANHINISYETYTKYITNCTSPYEDPVLPTATPNIPNTKASATERKSKGEESTVN